MRIVTWTPRRVASAVIASIWVVFPSTRATRSRSWPGSRRCGCRESRPCWSGGVFVEESAESVVSVDVQTCQLIGVGDRFGQRV